MDDSPVNKRHVLMLVENLTVPLDRRVWQEACALRDAGYAVTVICPRMHNYTREEEILEGIQIYRHRLHCEAKGFWGFFLEYASALLGETKLAWRVWRRHRFEVLHLCNPPDLLFLVAWPFKLRGVRVIYDVHDLWPEMFEAKFGNRGFAYRVVRAAARLNYACADLVLATNETNRQVAIERGKKTAACIFLVRTAPKLPRIDFAAHPDLKKNRTFLVGYVGVMGSADGVQNLLYAAAHLVQKLKRQDVQFLLMGSGPEYGGLLQLRDRLGLEPYVDMPGWAYDDLLFRALRTIDLGVTCDPCNAYNHSCTMNKVLEYMAFGKPQVMFDLKEGRASAGEAAHYVKENTPEALGDAINQLLNDPARRERMGRIGAERLAKQFNWEDSVRQLLEAYQTATAARSRRNPERVRGGCCP